MCKGYTQEWYRFQLIATIILLTASIDKKNPSYHLKSTPLIAIEEQYTPPTPRKPNLRLNSPHSTAKSNRTPITSIAADRFRSRSDHKQIRRQFVSVRYIRTRSCTEQR
nr:hypothetical protein Iba_chr09cCG13650 [Ipomoea batatas]